MDHLERHHDIAGEQIVVAAQDGRASGLAHRLYFRNLAFQVCKIKGCKLLLLLLGRHPELPCILQPGGQVRRITPSLSPGYVSDDVTLLALLFRMDSKMDISSPHQETILAKICALCSPGTCAACSCASRRAIPEALLGSAISCGSRGRYGINSSTRPFVKAPSTCSVMLPSV
jgi:hypothetical protein